MCTLIEGDEVAIVDAEPPRAVIQVARPLNRRHQRLLVPSVHVQPRKKKIFSALEVRKSAAKDKIAAADLEKLEKEELALKALKEQELIRDAVVAESQKLEQEAEENSKLREFLMDRGHVVDSLQGEIAIIFEDILSLKQRVDGHIPLTKSLLSSSSFTKSLMSSFLSSSGSSVNVSDYNRGSPSSTSHLTKEGNHEKNQNQKVEHATTNSLDDWELCEK